MDNNFLKNRNIIIGKKIFKYFPYFFIADIIVTICLVVGLVAGSLFLLNSFAF